ncbi:MAG: helix-turn-helix domain-containing protein [Bacteroidales bacterium]|nr:helix-turn-helix domain-containing protein [Bacteroidales bacterium]
MIQVLNRAFDILEFISKGKNKEYSLSEIADNLGLNHSTCANIIKTLMARGYLAQFGKRGGYWLGPNVYQLTGNFPLKEELLKVSIEPMKALRNKLNEGIIIAIIQNNKRILLHEEMTTHELRVANREEKEVYRTSTGRVMLACMTNSEQKAYVKKYGLPDEDSWPEIEDEEDFFNELNKIKKKQIAVHLAKSGIMGVAVPVFKKDKVIASLGVYLPKIRFTEEMQENIFKELPFSADQIMKELNIKQSLNE